ncbi:hypothetical protein AG1IA_07782 [Rhizoctonia solani AG-1 IA]|uniref:Uncharacterized protein n=1 Tax=Thanatephorus cucumeris (strain AG1-IA) TaxID=983506 RepID=L8WN26_THACA|nr:hypothetical protein AG1IA_07782 [Rhizoctonia solani AG-1 IA]
MALQTPYYERRALALFWLLQAQMSHGLRKFRSPCAASRLVAVEQPQEAEVQCESWCSHPQSLTLNGSMRVVVLGFEAMVIFRVLVRAQEQHRRFC